MIYLKINIQLNDLIKDYPHGKYDESRTYNYSFLQALIKTYSVWFTSLYDKCAR